MGKVAFKHILDMLVPSLHRQREGSNPTVLPPLHRFVIFLQFLRTNEFQRAVGTQHFIRVSQSQVSKTVKEVSELLAERVPEFVQLPSVEEGRHIAEEFYAQTGMPGVIGVIDGTHCEISKPPSGHNPIPERFYNRDGIQQIYSKQLCRAALSCMPIVF
jgi:hypothetical protein